MGKMKDKQLHDLAEEIGKKVTLELEPALDRILDDLPYEQTPWALSTILHLVMHRVWETCPDGMYATSMIVGTHDEVLSHYLQKRQEQEAEDLADLETDSSEAIH